MRRTHSTMFNLNQIQFGKMKGIVKQNGKTCICLNWNFVWRKTSQTFENVRQKKENSQERYRAATKNEYIRSLYSYLVQTSYLLSTIVSGTVRFQFELASIRSHFESIRFVFVFKNTTRTLFSLGPCVCVCMCSAFFINRLRNSIDLLIICFRFPLTDLLVWAQ